MMNTVIMLKNIHTYSLWLLLLLFSTSCSVVKNNFLQKEDLLYLQDQGSSYEKYKLEQYQIQPRDLLAINLTTPTLNTSMYFNRDNSSALRPNQSDPATLYRTGYSVTDSGLIDLPMLGNVMVAGKTITEIEDHISEKMKVYLKEFSISVKLTNFRVTLLGEVVQPGTFYFYEDKVTLLQAISQARGFSDFANVSKVRIIRDNSDKVETFILDMKSPDIVSNQRFILTQGDVIYVETLKAKTFRNNSTPISIILSVISLAVTTIAIISRP